MSEDESVPGPREVAPADPPVEPGPCAGDETVDEAVVLRDATKVYGDVVALDGVDLTFPPGALCCLAGPNGSGKTTALRLVAGLSRPTAGRVSTPDSVGISFQQPSVYPALSARENLRVFGSLVGADAGWRDTLVSWLRLGPALDRRVADLSDGYRTKLDLALALLGRPAVALFDEPLADLDDLTQRRAVALLAAYAGPGRVVVVSSHRIARFGDVLDRLAVVFDGAVLRADPASALERAPSTVYRTSVAREAGRGND
ncbi:MAG: ATP-binding cassette domain-containing protein [Halobacteriaceae archaeon]